MDTKFHPEKPLERIEGESAKANAALRDYFAMGAGRSLQKLDDYYLKQVSNKSQTKVPPTTKKSTLNTWSTIHHWVDRVKAKLEIIYKEEEAYWRERTGEVRQEDDRQSKRLRELADSILDEGPSFIKTKRRLIRGKKNEPDREIVTLALNIPQAIRLVELASKLQRLSAEMADPARRVEIEVNRELEDTLAKLEEKLDDNTFTRVLAAIAGEKEAGEAEEN